LDLSSFLQVTGGSSRSSQISGCYLLTTPLTPDLDALLPDLPYSNGHESTDVGLVVAVGNGRIEDFYMQLGTMSSVYACVLMYVPVVRKITVLSYHDYVWTVLGLVTSHPNIKFLFHF
jgi:hypothetical protein